MFKQFVKYIVIVLYAVYTRYSSWSTVFYFSYLGQRPHRMTFHRNERILLVRINAITVDHEEVVRSSGSRIPSSYHVARAFAAGPVELAFA